MPVIDEKQELAKKSDLATKQDILTPGTGITIQNNVISSTGGSTVTVSPTLSSGTPIAAITVDGNINTLFAPTPPTISVTQTQLSGDELATITVNGTPFTIYAPKGTTVLSGTSAPTSAQGENGDLYVQYTVTSGVYAVDMTYVKLSGEWIELAASGSEVEANPQGSTTANLSSIGIDGVNYAIKGLPDSYDAQPSYLTIASDTLESYNSLGWGVKNDIYYFDTAASWTMIGRSFTKSNATPALGAVWHPNDNNWYHSYLISTDADATVFSNNSQKTSFQYKGYTWYYSGGQYSMTSSSPSATGIQIVSIFSNSEFEDFLHYIIDQSQVCFEEYENTFTFVGAPETEYLFAGGGTQADLSDAAFKVTTEGDVIGNAFHGATTLANGSVGLVPAPLIADKDKFLKGDGTWAEGGGGGDVDDVYVNGTSVLDSDKIAQITSYKEVTQAEYDALPTSKLTDNILYCIKDKATADTTVAPVIYSEEEREIGVWTDGKPLYQITFSFTMSRSSAWQSYNHGIANIDKVVDVHSSFVVSNTTYPLPQYRDNSNSIITCAGATAVEWINTWVTDADVTCTLQYTKTTDQPGSGKWAPSGAPAVHYSTDEQVVGTWVDGSTVYEKTLYYSSISASKTDWTQLIQFDEADMLLSYNIRATWNNRQLDNAYLRISLYNGYLYHYEAELANGSTLSNYYATIRYTKTTP